MAESTDALIEKHRRVIDSMAVHHARRHEATGPQWLREDMKLHGLQNRAYNIEDKLFKRATTDDTALAYLEGHFGVEE